MYMILLLQLWFCYYRPYELQVSCTGYWQATAVKRDTVSTVNNLWCAAMWGGGMQPARMWRYSLGSMLGFFVKYCFFACQNIS